MNPKIAQPWKLPPIIKVYEALGAIADGRVQIADAHHATVASSDGSKTYAVEVEGRTSPPTTTPRTGKAISATRRSPC